MICDAGNMPVLPVRALFLNYIDNFLLMKRRSWVLKGNSVSRIFICVYVLMHLSYLSSEINIHTQSLT